MTQIPASSSARSRVLAKGIATSILSRGAAVISPLVTTPLTLHYLGSSLFGAWMTLVALTAMAAFADLGLGFGLMTKLAPHVASGARVEARQLISSAYAALATLAATLLVLLLLIGPSLPWESLLNTQSASADGSIRQVALVVLASFVVNIPLSLIARTQYAYQKVTQSNIWQAAGSVASVIAVAISVKSELSATTVIACAAFAAPVTYALNTAWFFGRQRPDLRPAWRHIDSVQGLSLVKLGGGFFVLTAIISLASNSDNLIIARTLGLDAVAQYSAITRIFASLGVLVSLVNVPLWPMVGEAMARGDRTWVTKITNQMTVISFFAVAVPGTILIFTGSTLVEAWLSKGYFFTTGLALGLTSWWILQATASPRFMVQNSVGILKPQLIGWLLFAITSIPLKVYASKEWGVAGVPTAGAVVYALTVIPGAILGYKRAISQKSEELAIL